MNTIQSLPASGPSAPNAPRTTAPLPSPDIFTAGTYHPGAVRHVVLFRYKDEVSPEQKAEVVKRFLALQSECVRDGHQYVRHIDTGVQNSFEGSSQGFEQGFIVDFASEGDRNYYVGQPAVTDPHYYDPHHQAFKDFAGPLLHEPVNPTGVLVFDFSVADQRPV